MENINNQSQANLAVMVSPTKDFTSMVPEDEQAVDTKLTLFGVSTDNILENWIPDEEKGVLCLDEDCAMVEARRLGLFSPAASMANIASSVTDKLYAIIRTDEKGRRYFEYCQQYEDGSFSPMMQVAQADLYLAASYGFLSRNITERKLRNRVENFLTRAYEDYMGKFTGEELLDVSQILQILFLARRELPVDMSSVSEFSRENFYKQVLKEALFLTNSELPRKSYFAFDDRDITFLAERLGMKKFEFLRKLKEFNLLYLTGASRGYQTCVRFKIDAEDSDSGKEESYTEWRYCIFRFDNLKGGSISQ